MMLLSPSAAQVGLTFHFDVEQRARSYLGWFFNFNGTAGVWRIAVSKGCTTARQECCMFLHSSLELGGGGCTAAQWLQARHMCEIYSVSTHTRDRHEL